jgi:hypothetical protein
VVGEVNLVLAAIFFEEELMQDLLGPQSDRLGASPEVIEAA